MKPRNYLSAYNLEQTLNSIETYNDVNLQRILFIRDWKESEALIQPLQNNLTDGNFRIAVVGQFSSGKTSFLNELFEVDIAPKGVEATTHGVTEFFWANKMTIQIWDEPSQVWQEVSVEEYKQTVKEQIPGVKPKYFRIGLNSSFLREHKKFIFVDTPGFNENDGGIDRSTSIEATKNADTLLLLVSVKTGTLPEDVINYLSNFYKAWNLHNSSSQKDLPPLRIILSRADLQKDAAVYADVKQEILTVLKKNELLDPLDANRGGGIFLFSRRKSVKEGTDWGDAIHADKERLSRQWDEWFHRVESGYISKCNYIRQDLLPLYENMFQRLNNALESLRRKRKNCQKLITLSHICKLIRFPENLGMFDDVIRYCSELKCALHEKHIEDIYVQESGFWEVVLRCNEKKIKQKIRKRIQSKYYAAISKVMPAWMNEYAIKPSDCYIKYIYADSPDDPFIELSLNTLWKLSLSGISYEDYKEDQDKTYSFSNLKEIQASGIIDPDVLLPSIKAAETLKRIDQKTQTILDLKEQIANIRENVLQLLPTASSKEQDNVSLEERENEARKVSEAQGDAGDVDNNEDGSLIKVFAKTDGPAGLVQMMNDVLPENRAFIVCSKQCPLRCGCCVGPSHEIFVLHPDDLTDYIRKRKHRGPNFNIPIELIYDGALFVRKSENASTYMALHAYHANLIISKINSLRQIFVAIGAYCRTSEWLTSDLRNPAAINVPEDSFIQFESEEFPIIDQMERKELDKIKQAELSLENFQGNQHYYPEQCLSRWTDVDWRKNVDKIYKRQVPDNEELAFDITMSYDDMVTHQKLLKIQRAIQQFIPDFKLVVSSDFLTDVRWYLCSTLRVWAQ